MEDENENIHLNDKDVNKGANEPFKITKEGIDYLIQKYLNRKFTEDIEYLNSLGGISFYEQGLVTSISNGLDESQENKEIRVQEFDSNEAPPEEPISFCAFFLEALQDKIIIILIIAAIVDLGVGIGFGHNPSLDWVDGFTIVIAVLVVSLVGSVNNYNKEIEFKRLKEENSKERKIFIRRKGEWREESEESLVVGDIIKIESGMTIPCDCLLVEGLAEIDESAMTGEIDPIMKATYENSWEKRSEILEKFQKKGIKPTHAHHDVESPIILSGTQVNQGDGVAIILAVGNNSENGKIRATINANKSSDDGTPLEQKLSDLADKIGWGGLIAAICTSVGMALNFGIRVGLGQIVFDKNDPTTIINIFIIGIVVVVVAIPEGLPLAVTMTLAYSIGKMLQDNNFVRRMESCETMGNAEYICTDKTGTLTKNEMIVTKCFTFGNDNIDLHNTVNDTYKGKPEDFFNGIEWDNFKLSLACNTNTTFDSD